MENLAAFSAREVKRATADEREYSSVEEQREYCTNQKPPKRGGAVPDPVWVGSN